MLDSWQREDLTYVMLFYLSMSHWSRNEPAVYMTYLRKSDHWSKLKHKVIQI